MLVMFTRRNEGISIWVVRSELIKSSQPDEKAEFFDPSLDKVYRHPTFTISQMALSTCKGNGK